MIGSNLDFGIKPLKSGFDVTNPESISEGCKEYNPSGILCLCNINIRLSEQNPFEAYKVNTLGIYNLVKEAKKRRIPLILISTGGVFSGNVDDSFNEESTPNPLNVYGQTKYLAELITLENSKNNLVVRTGWVFGANKNSEKKNIFDKMLDSAIEGKEIKAWKGEHTRLIIGFTGTIEKPTRVVVLDPFAGKQFWNPDDLIANGSSFDMSGVVVR